MSKHNCVKYTGIGAKPSGYHTDREFMSRVMDERTNAMCKLSEAAKRTIKIKVTDNGGKQHVVPIPRCPPKDDVKGWVKWTGAVPCTKTEAKKQVSKKKTTNKKRGS